ncbi:MAG: FlgD immunoglobulin-like domain containing protein [Candidatus Zixiibacteriota bacterium]
MKQNKLLILSLLASFLLLTLTSYAAAQNTVTFGTIDVCPQPAGSTILLPVSVANDVDLAALDIIGQVISTVGGVDLVVTNVSFDDRMALPEVLDQRYPIGDLGSGIFRLGAVKVNQTNLQPGSGQIATLTLEFVSDCALGTAVIDPGTYDCGSGASSTSFVDEDANLIVPDPINSGAVNVVNADPSFTNCPTSDYTIFWKNGVWGTNNVTIDFNADDPDLACGCDALSFTKLEGPGTINSATGVYVFTAGPAQIGCHNVIVQVEDEFGGTATCEFGITVTNNPPEFTVCPDETINIFWGETATATLAAVDPDLGPSALVYTLESYDGPMSSVPDVNPTTGAVSWETFETNDFIGDFEICVKVSDLAPSTIDCPIPNSDVCCFNVHVEPTFRVTIEKSHEVYLGEYTSLSIDLDDSYESMEFGGFDFLITYDNSVLSLVDALPGAMLTNCDWEYFTYRHGYDGNCGTGCPTGAVRIVALAETNNGPYHPSCFSSASGTQLAILNFYVSNNNLYNGLYIPVEFFWMDCGDNTISSKFGDSLFLADEVFAYYGDGGVDTYVLIPWHDGFPNESGTATSCFVGTEKGIPLHAIDFFNGGIDIIPNDEIDDRGDINMNGLAYEISDAVMFTNYFIIGEAAFGTHVAGSIAASDANADGSTLTIADLIYMIRVIQGDAQPYPKPSPEALFEVTAQGNTVTMNTNVDAGAALLVFNVDGTVGTPTVNNGMEVAYGVEGNELRVLVYNIGDNRLVDGTVLTLNVTGSAQLTEVEAGTFEGATMESSIRNLPTAYDLAQNYPNPFNPQTTIKLALPSASDYSLEIYNIAGQRVRTFSGSAPAGTLSIVWDGKDASGSTVASGVYFYKVVAGQYSDTKRMVMLK